jgi:hypothetical protein
MMHLDLNLLNIYIWYINMVKNFNVGIFSSQVVTYEYGEKMYYGLKGEY